MSATVDTVVIGAGVVGLAVARALALDGREVIVLEKNRTVGEETSSRNSEVIHAGIYYPAGSLKARLCVEGRQHLYAYCEANGIAHSRCGKVIVAIRAEQTNKLEAIRAAALANGVADVEWLTAAQVAALEPAVEATAGVWSPSTGIVDSHAFMLGLRGDLERAGGSVAVLSRLRAGRRDDDAITLDVEVEGEMTTFAARTVINAGGLHAERVALALGTARERVPRMSYARGHYFVLSGKSPFTHLVYPLPEDGGLGVHATLDLAGRTRFGPDVQWLTETDPEELEYRVPPERAAAFYGAIRTYWPALADGALEPGYAGIRPKISGSGEPAADFSIVAETPTGRARLVQLYGIESPGLTASLAIAEHVATVLRQ